MKKVLIVFPLAVMLANCSSSHKSASSANAGANASTSVTTGTSMNSDMSASGTTGTAGASASVGTTASAGTTGTASTETSSTSGVANSSVSGNTGASASGTTGASTSANVSTTGSSSVAANNNTSGTQSSPGVPAAGSGYDPNNYMQNPDKYLAPYLLTKTGGWTYSNDWRRNTNFPAEAEGNWQLVLTPEVASSWIRDTSRPETYASYWTPDAVAGRQQVLMAAAMRSMDSIRALDSIATMAKASSKSGKKSGKYSHRSSGMTASARMRRGKMGVSGSGTTGAMGTGGMSTTTSTSSTDNSSAANGVSGSGTTGATATGGMSASGSMSNAGSNTSVVDSTGSVATSFLTAVNGNNFLMPAVNLYIGNGTFTAYTGCNDALGTMTVDGTKLHFEQATPSTNIQCVGGFDQTAFMDRLSRADNFDIVNNQIRLKQGEQVLMVFAKAGK